MSSNNFGAWRLVHRGSSLTVALFALVHCGVTFMMYREWSPDAVWFFGTGVGLLTSAVMNIAHVGLEPCRQPTAPAVRWLNWLFVALGLAALYAVREPQAFVIVAALLAQAVAGVTTLSGPAKDSVLTG
jgi:hypothetical protein